MSPGFSYTDVSINSIRRPYSPVLRFGALFGSKYRSHMIDITLNKTDEVTCRFVEIPAERKFMVVECESNTADAYHDGFIFYEDLGVEVTRY